MGTLSSIIRIPSNTMSSTSSYAFSVVATSRDGRSDTKTVVVTPTSTGNVGLSITTSFTRFNPTSKLVVNSYITGATAVTSVWSILTPLGMSVPFTALTPSSKQFPATDASSQIIFPISLDAYALSAGSAYTFRLTAFPTNNPGANTYTEIVLIANSPPTGGYISVIPPSGKALETNFAIASPGWTTEVANFPLTYMFSYRLSAVSLYLTLAASSLRAFTTSTLPAGLSTENSLVTLKGATTDIYSTVGTATATAEVTLNAATNLSHVLTTQLLSAFASGNVNLAFQTVNNVSHDFDLQIDDAVKLQTTILQSVPSLNII